ncbi:MAG: two-component system LytT family response regulator [Bacteroidia bacterium]|jgi:two-component system LytT family response regulator
MKIIIIDDEINSIRVTKSLLKEYGNGVELIGEFTDPKLALSQIKETKPDLLLLDIEMPGMNGFELLDKLDLDEINVVFVTAYDQYAIKAIKCSAIDYILKPFSLNDLKIALDKTTTVLKNGKLRAQAIAQKRQEYIIIPGLREYVKVNLNEIVYAEGQRGGYTMFCLLNGAKAMASKPLSYYQDVLNDRPFIKIHKSHIINVNEMKKFNSATYKITMSNNVELDLAHRRKPAFLKYLKGK